MMLRSTVPRRLQTALPQRICGQVDRRVVFTGDSASIGRMGSLREAQSWWAGASSIRAFVTGAPEVIVDTANYPDLCEPAFLKQCRAQLAVQQTCRLPRFLTPETVANLVNFVEAERRMPGKCTHPGTTWSTIFYQEPSAIEELGDAHPLRRLVSRSNTYITAESIPEGIPLRRLQDDPGFQAFLEAVTGETLFEYACPVSKFVFSLADEKDHQDWHFDNNFLTLTFMLQKPAHGGLLEVHPRIGRENYEEISRILEGSAYSTPRGELLPDSNQQVQEGGEGPQAGREEFESSFPKLTYEYEVGDMILFIGRDSLHRCTKISGDRTRMIGIISYNTRETAGNVPNAVHMEKVYNLRQHQA